MMATAAVTTTIRLPVPLAERLEEEKRKTGEDKTAIITAALLLYFEAKETS